MKQLFVLVLLSFIFCKAHAQLPGAHGADTTSLVKKIPDPTWGWQEQKLFKLNCMKNLPATIKKESAEPYCSCVLNQVMQIANTPPELKNVSKKQMKKIQKYCGEGF